MHGVNRCSGRWWWGGGGDTSAPFTSCILLILAAERSEELSSTEGEKPQTRKPAGAGCVGWILCPGSCAHRTHQSFDFSFFHLSTLGDLKKTNKPCARFVFCFAPLLCHSSAGRDLSLILFFFFGGNITGFVVGAFPFINVH